jgi:hypothetical protein
MIIIGIVQCSDVVYCIEMSCVVQFCLYYGALLPALWYTFICVLSVLWLLSRSQSAGQSRAGQDRTEQDWTGQIEREEARTFSEIV